MPELALNMILGKLREPFLPYALLSVKDIASEFVIVDTWPGENENLGVVKEIIPDAKIVEYHHDGIKGFSYGEARNVARDNTESPWILRQDADEVHYPALQQVIDAIPPGADSVRCYFYHLMVSPFLCQYDEIKAILYRKELQYSATVHEELQDPGVVWEHPYHFVHYGYCVTPFKIFAKWVWYAQIDTKIPDNWYDGYNPHLIINDRPPVCKEFPPELHPPIMQEWLENERSLPVAIAVEDETKIVLSNHRAGLYKVRDSFAVSMNQLLRQLMYDSQFRYVLFCPKWVSVSDPDWVGDMVRVCLDSPDIGRVNLGGTEGTCWLMPLSTFEHIGGFDENLTSMKSQLLDIDARLRKDQWRTIEYVVPGTVIDVFSLEEPTSAETERLRQKHG